MENLSVDISGPAQQAREQRKAAQALEKQKERGVLEDFLRREGVPALIVAAQREIRDFPLWWQREIAPALEQIAGVDQTQEVANWCQQLKAPMFGGTLVGVHIPPLVKRLEDGLAFVKGLKPEDVTHLNGYRIAQATVAQKLKSGDVRGSLLLTVGRIKRYLRDLNASQAGPVAQIQTAPARTETAAPVGRIRFNPRQPSKEA